MAPPRSLNAADIVVSISGESLQRQVEALYGTKLDDGSDYVINRNVRISFKKENGELSKYGLFGYIECPQIDLTGDTVLKRDGKFSIAKLSMKFIQNPKKLGNEGQSYLFYYDMAKEEEVKQNINGHTLTWEVNVGFRDIQSVIKEIVNRPNVTKKTREELMKYVDFAPDQLLASALFCSFESSRMMNSFKMKDPDGKFLDNRGQVAFSINTIVSYFQDNADGTPNKDNPFLLGYTISQKVPDLKDVNGKPLVPAPRYFVPSSFICTVSPRVPCPNNEAEVPTPSPSPNDKCQGAINYIMRTLRPDGIAVRPPLVAGNDGKFDENLFATIGRKADPGGMDGLMVISADTFTEWFLSTFLKRDLIEAYEKELVQDGYKIYVRPNGKESGPTADGRKTSFYSYIEKIGKHPKDRHPTAKCLLDRTIFNTERTLEVEFSNNAVAGDDDVKRSVQIVFTIKTILRYDEQHRRGKSARTQGIVYGSENGDQNDKGWNTPFGFEMHSNLQYTFDLRPSTNRGQIELKLMKTLHLNDDKSVKWKTLDKNEENGFKDHYWGVTAAPSTRVSGLSSFFFPAWVKDKVNEGKDIGWDYAEALDKKVSEMGEMLKSSIFLPAAEIFMFKGVDVDENGNVYVGITYDTITEGNTTHST